MQRSQPIREEILYEMMYLIGWNSPYFIYGNWIIKTTDLGTDISVSDKQVDISHSIYWNKITDPCPNFN